MKSLASARLAPVPSVLHTPSREGNVIVRAIGVTLPDSIRLSAEKKATKLLRHHPRIIRIRIDFEQRHANDCDRPAMASGRVEISGPDLVATVGSTHLGKSLDLLVEKLDRMVRERTKGRVNRRNDRPEGAEFRDFIAAPSA